MLRNGWQSGVNKGDLLDFPHRDEGRRGETADIWRALLVLL